MSTPLEKKKSLILSRSLFYIAAFTLMGACTVENRDIATHRSAQALEPPTYQLSHRRPQARSVVDQEHGEMRGKVVERNPQADGNKVLTSPSPRSAFTVATVGTCQLGMREPTETYCEDSWGQSQTPLLFLVGGQGNGNAVSITFQHITNHNTNSEQNQIRRLEYFNPTTSIPYGRALGPYLPRMKQGDLPALNAIHVTYPTLLNLGVFHLAGENVCMTQPAISPSDFRDQPREDSREYYWPTKVEYVPETIVGGIRYYAMAYIGLPQPCLVGKQLKHTNIFVEYPAVQSAPELTIYPEVRDANDSFFWKGAPTTIKPGQTYNEEITELNPAQELNFQPYWWVISADHVSDLRNLSIHAYLDEGGTFCVPSAADYVKCDAPSPLPKPSTDNFTDVNAPVVARP